MSEENAYKEYIQTVVEYRRSEIEKWKLTERTEEDYEQISYMTPYNLDQFDEKFAHTHIGREQSFYFITRYQFRRVSDFLKDVNTLEAQIKFLLEIQSDFERDVKKLWVLRNNASDYGARDLLNFGDLCQVEIRRIKETINLFEIDGLPKTSGQMQSKFENRFSNYGSEISPQRLQDEKITRPKFSRKSGDLTARQSIIFLLSLMYGTSEVPDEVNKTELANFIESLKSIDSTNIYKYVCSPISAKAESIKERNSRVKDIKSVISLLQTLKISRARWKGIEEKIKKLEDEIQHIKDFKDEDNEEKRSHF